MRNMRTVNERTTARLSSLFCCAIRLSTVRFIAVPSEKLSWEKSFFVARDHNFGPGCTSLYETLSGFGE